MKTTVLREQIQQSGAHSLSDEELLALILCADSAPARVSTLRQVRNLFADCGDVRHVLCAEFGEICLAHGFGEAKTAQLQAILELAKRLAAPPPVRKTQILNADDAAALVRNDLMYLDHEQLRVLVLDTKSQVIANVCLYQGTINSSLVRIAEVFRVAVTRKAPKIIVCHNHPSGDPAPSPEDIELTTQLAQAGSLLGITLLDHLIIGNPRYVSLKAQMNW